MRFHISDDRVDIAEHCQRVTVDTFIVRIRLRAIFGLVAQFAGGVSRSPLATTACAWRMGTLTGKSTSLPCDLGGRAGSVTQAA
jgi:hypothetical protein